MNELLLDSLSSGIAFVLNFLAEFFNACLLLQNLNETMAIEVEAERSRTKHESLLDHNSIAGLMLTYPPPMGVCSFRMHHSIVRAPEE